MVTKATDATLKDVLVGSSVLATSKYTFASGSLTLKTAYLSTLTAGTYTFTVEMSDGTSASTTVTVTA